MAKPCNQLDNIITGFKSLTQNPEKFLSCDDKLNDQIKVNLKGIYDFTKNEEKRTKSNALPELIVESFDLEQIWQQIELQNDTILAQSLANISKLVVNKNQLVSNKLNDHDDNISENAEEDEKENAIKNDSEESESSDSDSVNDLLLKDESYSETEDLDNNSKINFKSSVVDDDFFKLNEMEKFLNAEEKKIDEPDSGNDSESEEGSIDYFEASSEDEDDNQEKTAKYKDFFVQKDSTTKIKRNKFLEDMDSDEHDDMEPESTLEKRQKRLQEKIDEIEENAVSEKPWQLKGEITAESRPQNSLLEEIVEFDMTQRPAPVITEQTTLQLEDIIRQRIKDKVFDSVERKAKPVETPLEYKKKLVLDQEKSKQSLAQIYEKEYLDQQAALNLDSGEKEEEDPALHKEIKTMMKDLFHKLDSLSNFHFTPKPAIPELKIVSNLPAINMEEVAPVASSDAALLAPEEIKKKTKGDIIGKSERTTTDKKREKRKKKLKQKIHAKEKSRKEESSSNSNKFSKDKSKKLLEKMSKERNIDKMDQTAKSIKSSTAFFTQLQEEVQTQIKNSTHKNKRKKENFNVQAKKLKL